MKILKHAYRGRRQRNCTLLLLTFFCLAEKASAQDPVLPPTNLGLANVYDGVAGKPGFVYQGYVQVFQTRQSADATGNSSATDLKVNSVLSMNQLIFLSPVKLLGGNLGFTVLVPIVQINSSNLNGPAPTVNPAVIGDLVQGTAIQWSGKKLFGRPFFHRVEADINIPVGGYDQKYNINPSAHLWAFGAYHAFTIMLSEAISLSARNQFNYNARTLGHTERSGAYYNGNYSVDLTVVPGFKIEAAAYFLSQFNQDSADGNSQYYAQKYNITNTKERVLGYGPGIAYFAPNGVLFEAKVFFETAGRNRLIGTRPTLRLAIPLTK